jgi:3-oxoacyl-[acyl-carrier-protein] synthase III
MPSVASQVQSRLNIPNAGTIDISSACAGFVNGIILAKGLIASSTHKKILVIGADMLSKVTDFTDRTTCILFGGELHELARKNNVTLEDIDYFIPHSANYRLLEAVFNELNIPMEKCLDSVRLFGNTSTASIPLAWYSAIKEGKLKLNDKVMLVGFGGGFTCAGIYIKNNIV